MRKSRFAESLLKARSKGEITSPSVISLYGVHRVTIEPGCEMKEMFGKTQATLEEINKTLKKLAGKDEQTVQIVKEVLLQALEAPESAKEIEEPAELSLPEEDWNRVSRSKCLMWREENGEPIIKYRNEIVRPSWTLMKKLSKMRPQERSAEIHRLMRNVDKKETRHRFSAYNVFADCIKYGNIIVPGKLKYTLRLREG
jgi:hypothetical protein